LKAKPVGQQPLAEKQRHTQHLTHFLCDLHMFSWQQPLKPAMQMQIENKTENKNGHAVCSLESKVKA